MTEEQQEYVVEQEKLIAGLQDQIGALQSELADEHAINLSLQEEINANTTYVIHRDDRYERPKVYVKAERNTKGYNWEVSVSDAKDVDTAIAMLTDAEAKMKAIYGQKEKEE